MTFQTFGINNNMRCIETEETVIDQATGEDK